MPDKDLHTITVGTRESKLALLQTVLVVGRLHGRFPDIAFRIKPVTTHGDKVLSKPIAEVGSRGVFVKELEEALLANDVDLVVHSLKDLPTELPTGLTLAAVLDRQDPRDVLVSRNRVPFQLLPAGSKVATSSLRRAAQLKAARQDVEFIDIRGNIPTRLRKLDEGACDAMVLAAAGLLRLGETGRIAEYLDVEFSTPAAGQGALAVECRQGDDKILELAATIEDKPTRAEVTAEREFLEKLGGGCSVPIGAVCFTLADGRLRLTGCVASLDGSRILRRSLDGEPDRAADLGARLADVFFDMGAGEVLSRLKESAPATVSPP